MLFNETYIKDASTNRYESVEVDIMQQVQACSWNPFRMNEIVTLEKCLQQTLVEDPRLETILRKLAKNCVFVEPARKLKHLARDEQERRADLSLMRQAQARRNEINDLNKEIECVQTKIGALTKRKDDTCEQIKRLRKAILLVEKTYEVSQKEFEYMFELVLNSFSRSIHTINSIIPNFIQTLTESNLIKQPDNLPKLYGRCLLKLVKSNKFQQLQSQPQLATQFSYYTKLNMIKHLRYYLEAVCSLHKDLNLIDKLYSSEIPYEYEVLSELKKHIDFLVKPIGPNPPKRVIILHHEVRSLCPLELPQMAGEPADTNEDPAIGQLCNKISAGVRSAVINNVN